MENSNDTKKVETADLQQCAVMPSLRDYIAVEAMKAKIMVWDSDISDKHRSKILKDIIERYGNITLNKAFCKMCYEIADEMIAARNGA